jgi:protocatechuate 3,4-dioxygenase beta subunit
MTILRALAGPLLALLMFGTAAAQPRCAPTRPDAEGPFYKPGAPIKAATGSGLAVEGVVRTAASCDPIPGARVEWWQANARAEYTDSHRGALVTGPAGTYRFETDPPPPYAGRPSHVHVKVRAPGHRTLTTQIYPKAGQTAITFDLVLVKE